MTDEPWFDDPDRAQEMATVTGSHDHDHIADEIAQAVTTGNVPDTGIDRSPAQNEAAKALAAAARREADQRDTAKAAATEAEPPTEARPIAELAAITNRIPPGNMRVALDIPNHLAATIIAQRLPPNADVTDLDLLDTLAEHITAHLPHTIGPTPTDLWLETHHRHANRTLGPTQRHPHMTDRHLYRYAATVTNVYDGDTITVDLDLGFDIIHHNQKIRLWGINTPEIRGDERPHGLSVRDRLRELLDGQDIVIRTHYDRTGRYGRVLGEVFITRDGGWVNVNELLVDEGHSEIVTYGDPFNGWATLEPTSDKARGA